MEFLGILFPLFVIFLSCLFIWRACDGFEVASEYIGRNMSEGVRGGTINAISSSLPELLTTMIALVILGDVEGFAVGIGTTAGSALFNGMVIPAVCILVVMGGTVFATPVTAVRVSYKVIMRDGIALILACFFILVILMGHELGWQQGLLLMLCYLIYFLYMIKSMKVDDSGDEEEDDEEPSWLYKGGDKPKGRVGYVLYCLSLGPLLDLEKRFIGEKHEEEMRNETWNGWPLLLFATVIIAAACYWLVKGCEWLGSGPGNVAHPDYMLFGQTLHGIGMPTLFVAVIFASMATSVPDTIISMRDARDGDYDDAVANALGSNIFDICFALGLPLFLYTVFNGPINMVEGSDIQLLSGELRFLLLVLTIISFVIYLAGKRDRDRRGGTLICLTRRNGSALLALYIIFVVYIVARSQKYAWAESIGQWIQDLMAAIF